MRGPLGRCRLEAGTQRPAARRTAGGGRPVPRAGRGRAARRGRRPDRGQERPWSGRCRPASMSTRLPDTVGMLSAQPLRNSAPRVTRCSTERPSRSSRVMTRVSPRRRIAHPCRATRTELRIDAEATARTHHRHRAAAACPRGYWGYRWPRSRLATIRADVTRERERNVTLPSRE